MCRRCIYVVGGAIVGDVGGGDVGDVVGDHVGDVIGERVEDNLVGAFVRRVTKAKNTWKVNKNHG
jgi:hypothetical protein